MRKKREMGWAKPFHGLDWVLVFLFLWFSLLFSFPNTLKLFEFKHKFEFKSYALNQNKTMHQHECTNIFNLEKI